MKKKTFLSIKSEMNPKINKFTTRIYQYKDQESSKSSRRIKIQKC